jgi:DNA (cytosine-5)-methyltransferase 1
MFAGIGGFDLGFERAGFEVVWCIEWDKHSQAVLRKRFPNVTIYGDIREVDAAQLAPVDVVCGGFPCQDLSVAGKRAGLAGERSGLFHDAIRLVRKLNPKLLVLENVPGLLSSNQGLDFATVLREVGEGWNCAEVAWRVLDSRYFGVAQRRRRVFVVAGAREGHAEQILAFQESVRWNPAPSGKAREDVAGTIAARFGISRNNPEECVIGAIDCNIPKQRAQNAQQGHYIACLVSSQGQECHKESGGPDRDETDLSVAQAFRKSKRAQSCEDDETWVDDGLANTLNGFDTGDTRTTHAVAYTVDMQACKGNANIGDGSVSPTLCKPSGNDVHAVAGAFSCKDHGADASAVATCMVVRRLTPVECERLQGFPDGWTQIGTDEKPTADTHRYKQLGNAVTVNVAEWIAKRAHDVLVKEVKHDQ